MSKILWRHLAAAAAVAKYHHGEEIEISAAGSENRCHRWKSENSMRKAIIAIIGEMAKAVAAAAENISAWRKEKRNGISAAGGLKAAAGMAAWRQ
jgi:hypothetical protein